ncbi:glycosyltransferase family 4 protein [Candidatus Viridilinea mediisalina]|uniref:Glycosyl transferase family 1 n=1 Tax=Candidatus Viridilinea mediisalina TaxID=2024553 RepID=A0A2A6REK0_9CHLR|nr:glycosyltransferase family 4 protein [Candidatus Viridilinea mediisalina]PDW01002.1 glycosyl transferase family 1 [Candidatus Viridilinea mediisalina]
MKIPRIAYCSPVNPAPSGISDYSEELLPYLGQYAELTLFVEDGLRPSNRLLTQQLEVLPLRRLPRELRRRPYDALVYHMGNSPAHAGIWRSAQRLPGVVVLHDFVLHHFMLWYAANVQRDIQLYVRAMLERYGEPGGHIAQLMIRSRFSDAAFDFPCCEPVLAQARGLIAHSHYVAERVAALSPALPRAVVPMGVPSPPPIERNAARARLGLPQDGAILASFGHINAWKRIEPTLRALAALRAEGREVRYLLVGSVSPNYDLKGLIERSRLSEAVRITGYAPREQFEDYVAAADICVNLRYPTGGETSASLLRLLGAGRPTLVSAVGAFAELPPGVVAQVDPGPAEGDQILAYCRLLLDRPELAEQLGQQARSFVAREHTLAQAAQSYIRFLARLYGWPMVVRHREQPLWHPEPTATSAASVAAAPAPQPLPPASPLVQTTANAMQELGLSDSALLRRIAQRITEVS